MAETLTLEQLFAAHEYRFHGMESSCSCGTLIATAESHPWGDDEPRLAHLADAVRAWLLGQEGALVRVFGSFTNADLAEMTDSDVARAALDVLTAGVRAGDAGVGS